jgi:hypothetical protein
MEVTDSELVERVRAGDDDAFRSRKRRDSRTEDVEDLGTIAATSATPDRLILGEMQNAMAVALEGMSGNERTAWP